MSSTSSTEKPADWYIQVNGEAYGPYDAVRLTGFVEEGRISEGSLLGNTRAGPWHPASVVTPYLFGASDASLDEMVEEHFGVEAPVSNRDTRSSHDTKLHYFVFVTPLGSSQDAISLELAKTGFSLEVGGGVWFHQSECSAARLRTVVSRALLPDQRLVIAPADNAAWFNLGL